LSETFLIIRKVERDLAQMHTGLNGKYSMFFSDFFETWIFFDRFSNNTCIKCHENPTSWSRVVPCRRTDRQDGVNNHFSQFCQRPWTNSDRPVQEESTCTRIPHVINPLNAELNPICHLLALLGAHHILHVSGIRVNCHKTQTQNIREYYDENTLPQWRNYVRVCLPSNSHSETSCCFPPLAESSLQY
jgi:hypothetical protein